MIEGIRAPDFLQTTRAFSGPHSVRHYGDADAGLLVQQFHPLQFFQHFNTEHFKFPPCSGFGLSSEIVFRNSIIPPPSFEFPLSRFFCRHHHIFAHTRSRCPPPLATACFQRRRLPACCRGNRSCNILKCRPWAYHVIKKAPNLIGKPRPLHPTTPWRPRSPTRSLFSTAHPH